MSQENSLYVRNCLSCMTFPTQLNCPEATVYTWLSSMSSERGESLFLGRTVPQKWASVQKYSSHLYLGKWTVFCVCVIEDLSCHSLPLFSREQHSSSTFAEKIFCFCSEGKLHIPSLYLLGKAWTVHVHEKLPRNLVLPDKTVFFSKFSKAFEGAHFHQKGIWRSSKFTDRLSSITSFP